MAALVVGVVAAKADAVTRIPHRCKAEPASKLCAIHFHHKRVNRYRGKMGLSKIAYHWIAESHPARRIRILTYWTNAQEHAAARYRAWVVSPMTWYNSSGAACVHSKEGSWTSNTGNGYYGGFQYDPGTWSAAHGTQYAPRADLASPLQQIIVTMHKVKDQGWGAWPNTARECGLL